MKIDEVNQAMINGSVIRHTHHGTSCRYKLSGVITRYSPVRGWQYSLELRDIKADSITIANLEDCEVEENVNI